MSKKPEQSTSKVIIIKRPPKANGQQTAPQQTCEAEAPRDTTATGTAPNTVQPDDALVTRKPE